MAAKSQKERDDKAQAKREELDEKELRHRCRRGTRDKLAELMAWHGITEQAEAIQLLIWNAHALGPKDSAGALLIPRHDLAISENVAQKLDSFVPPADEDDNPALWGTVHDPLYAMAIQLARETGQASVMATQRRLGIGFNRAARLIETMEADAVVTAPDHKGRREVIG